MGAVIRKILVVDNNATIVELLGSHLAAAGFEVVKAYDGLQALDRLVESQPLPDAIILDLIMPRLDGQRLTRFLKQDELYGHIPIVILTGIAREDEGQFKNFGADAYIAKGRVDDTMAHVLETFAWLERRSGPAERRETILGIEKLFPREMTRELLHMKGHLDTMLAMMAEGMLETDADDRILFANPAACALLGAEDRHLFGRTLPDVLDTPAVAGYLAEAPCGAGRPYGTLRIERGGRTLQLCATRLEERDNLCGAIVLLQDVTAAERRERTLRDLMEAIVQSAPVGLCLLGPAGKVLAANPAFASILRLPDSRVALGADLAASLTEAGLEPTDLIPLSGAPRDGEARPVEFTTTSYPERVVLTVSATDVPTAEGPRLLLLVEDVTEKAAMERDLRRVNEELAKASRAKSTFLSMVSHELRTPLSVVRGYLSLILENKIGPEPERVRDALRVADKRARHLQHLIEELLDLSRIETGRLVLRREPVDVRKHVLETVEMFRDEAERKAITVSVTMAEDLPAAMADHDKVHQILTNFLSNAVKFTGDGGRVEIGGRSAGPWLEYWVTDTGIGIPPDKVERIFEKFYQVESSDKRLYPGTGLGLAIVRMITAALGGKVRVQSEVGKGSTFTLTLPRAEAAAEPEAEPAAGPAAEAAPLPRRLRVLAVDDDADTLSMIRLLLPEDRFELIEARDAFEGLRAVHAAVPDVVLADALLPIMSGLELCRIVKTHPALGATRVIILSAAAQEDEIRSGFQVGADDYLVKPFSPQDLLERLGRIKA